MSITILYLANIKVRPRRIKISIFIKSIEITLIMALLSEIQCLSSAISLTRMSNLGPLMCALFLSFLAAIESRLRFESKIGIVILAKTQVVPKPLITKLYK